VASNVHYKQSGRIKHLATIGVVGLVAAAALTRLLTKRAEAQHRPSGRLIEIDGETVHVIDEGSGPCVVLLHGNGGMVEDFKATTLIENLAKTNRVILLDRPGFGLSTRTAKRPWTPELEAEHVSDILAHLEVRNPVIVAHSWGTLVAVALAIRDQSAIAGLVLLSGYYYRTTRIDTVMQTPASLPLIGPLLRHTVIPLLSRLSAPLTIKHVFAPMKVPLRFLRLYSVPMASRPSQLKSVAGHGNVAVRVSASIMQRSTSRFA